MLEKKREQELKAILKRYVNNQATLSEMEAVDRWYDALEFEVSTAQLFEQQLDEGKPVMKMARRCLIWSAAAAVLLATFTALWFFQTGNVSPVKDTMISSGKMERKQVTLSDGTIVMLNTGSELIVSGDFDDELRQVRLNGEAYFKVAKNAAKPFIIHSGQLTTRVLGTSFNISAYPDRERIKVSVLTGRVMVSHTIHNKDQVLATDLTANHTISYSRKTGKSERNREDANLITSWRDNKLYVDNATIQDIAELLKGFYHLEVNDLSKAKENDRYTIRFNRESMRSVLQILTQLTKKDFQYTDNQITIK